MCFIKYAWVKPLNDEKDKKAKTFLHGFIVEIVNEPKCKLNKL